MQKSWSMTVWRGAFLAPFVLAVAGGGALAAVTLPHPQPGWWQTTRTSHTVDAGQPAAPDDPPVVTYNCQNDASWEAGMNAMSTALPGCTIDIEGGGNSYTMTTNCTSVGGSPGTIQSTGTITYDGQSAVHIVSDTKSDVPALKMNETDHTVADSQFLGACPSGVVPGDYGTMQNGVFHKEFNTLSK